MAFLANEAKNYKLVLESIVKAADMMLEDGTRDSAGIILEKAAKYRNFMGLPEYLTIFAK